MNKYSEEIIRYLSKEMSLKEQEDFKLRLEQDSKLYQEYDTIKQVWSILREQLGSECPEIPSDQDEKIAGILAEHDYEQLKDLRISQGEKSFREVLNSNFGEKETIPENQGYGRVISIGAIVSVAALILLLLLPGMSLEQLLRVYNDPGNDAFLLNLAGQTRSEEYSASFYFYKGDYEKVVAMMDNSSATASEHEKLYFGISLYETGRNNEAINILEGITRDSIAEADLIVAWYLGIYLIESGHSGNGRVYLEEVIESDNPYQRKAKRLLRKL